MLAKNSLTLAKQGYELMDKKRNILIRELMEALRIFALPGSDLLLIRDFGMYFP